MMKLERIFNTEEKNKILAEFLGYTYNEEDKRLSNEERLTDIIWIPQHDFNQLFWIMDKLIENGYKYLIMDNIFELSKNDILIVSTQERTIKTSIYEGLVKLISLTFEN